MEDLINKLLVQYCIDNNIDCSLDELTDDYDLTEKQWDEVCLLNELFITFSTPDRYGR